MCRIATLPGRKGIAVSGRTGSGKSSIFFNSVHVIRVLVADSGSGGHAIYKRDTSIVVDTVADNKNESPVQQCMRLVKEWTEKGYLWVVDSFTTMQEQQVMWHKKYRTDKQQMSLREHMHVVGDLRDLALALASRPGFTIFNTSPGGTVRTPDGQTLPIPKGVLVGYPALSGLAEGKESVLSRFTSSWIVMPGMIGTANRAKIARGFIVPWHDIRGGDIGNFAPIKDPLRVLEFTKNAPEHEGEAETQEEVDAFLPFDPLAEGFCTIDAMLERIADKFPSIRLPPKEQVAGAAQPGAVTPADGKPPIADPAASAPPARGRNTQRAVGAAA